MGGHQGSPDAAVLLHERLAAADPGIGRDGDEAGVLLAGGRDAIAVHRTQGLEAERDAAQVVLPSLAHVGAVREPAVLRVERDLDAWMVGLEGIRAE